MELARTLEEFGLDKNEANVYLELLQLGPSPVLQIARRTGLKRPTVYLILDRLIERGLAVVVPQEKKKLFLALPPARLVEDFERRTRLIEGILPELSALYRTKTLKPAIQFFESHEGMMSVYRDITERSDIKEVLTFFSFEAIPKEFDENYELFLKLLKTRKVICRDIISTNSPRHFYLEQTKRLPNYHARLAPPECKFMSDTIIYGNKIAILSFKKRFALIIESDDVAHSFRSLFELAWESAERI